jgi:hypothetical protein
MRSSIEAGHHRVWASSGRCSTPIGSTSSRRARKRTRSCCTSSSRTHGSGQTTNFTRFKTRRPTAAISSTLSPHTATTIRALGAGTRLRMRAFAQRRIRRQTRLCRRRRSLCLNATATLLELPPLARSRTVTSCLSTGCSASARSDSCVGRLCATAHVGSRRAHGSVSRSIETRGGLAAGGVAWRLAVGRRVCRSGLAGFGGCAGRAGGVMLGAHVDPRSDRRAPVAGACRL